MPTYERIPFIEAISEPMLFKKGWESLSIPQQVILKAVYGLELAGEQEHRLWSAMSGAGVYDDLGYLVDITHDVPYIPQEYADITLILGRRSGKTDRLSSCIIAYEALCGGHKGRVDERQDPVFLQVAQDLQTARANLRQFIYKWLASSPIGKKELEHFGASALTADTIKLRNGLITVGPPTIKLRSQALACCSMDELCVWPKDRDASNPDIEVERAVTPALMQFYPFDKIIKVSTPMTEEGLLWQADQIGTKGCKLADEAAKAAQSRRLVLRAPTALMDNPHAKRAYLIEQRAKDAEAFPREYLAQFAKSVSGFLNTDLLRHSVTSGLRVRPAEPGQFYVATLDPAFRRDAFAFTIGHMRGGDFVQDFLCSWKGTKDAPLRPGAILDQISAICYSYGVRMVTSDQYHNDTLMELALSRGLTMESIPLTGEIKQRMWADLNSLLLQQKLHLLDIPELLDELMKMERVLTKFGNVQFAGGGAHDDLAMVTALCVHKALMIGEPTRQVIGSKPPSVVSEVRKRVQARARAGHETEGAWWSA